MDGTALYEVVSVIFIAQLNARELTNTDLLVTSLTATLAAMGAASVPSAGQVAMMIVLNALNPPLEQISLIYTVDWLFYINNLLILTCYVIFNTNKRKSEQGKKLNNLA
jgi:Na+/H+-dicarboxylate symporter